jgi:hypothetical protein
MVIMELAATLEQSSNPVFPNCVSPPVSYNLVNPAVLSWGDVSAELKKTSLDFEVVTFSRWLQKLRDSTARGDEIRNPSAKLVDYYKHHFLSENNDAKEGAVIVQTRAAVRETEVMQSPLDLIAGGNIRKFVAKWMQRWDGTERYVNGTS